MYDSTQDASPTPVSAATIRRSWHIASRIVAKRPWLDVSWLEGYDYPAHVVVHDGSDGPALHFDDDEGPTWEPRTSPEQILDWEDVADLDLPDPLAPVDWAEQWGGAASRAQLTPKVAVYTLIAHLLDRVGDDPEWQVRHAKLVHDTDESADAPDSAFTLTGHFTSLGPAVRRYVEQISGVSWGDGTVWHEPLWLMTCEGRPVLVLDEDGTVHMAADSLSEVLLMMAVQADLGGIDEPWRVDVLTALAKVGGFASLAALLRRGPAETARAVNPMRRIVQP